jgi:hypothetical protein
MGGKFRVKVGWKRRQFCAGTAAESINRRIFMIRKRRSNPLKTLFAWQIGCDTRQ